MRPQVVCLAFVAGCHIVSGLDTFQLEVDGEGGGGSGGTTSAGGEGPVGGSGGGEALDLVDRGVLARWFLDEPESATTVADAVTPPVDLTVVRNDAGFPMLTGAPGVRGVTWDEAGTNGLVRVAIAGNKLESLDGKRQATIEAVMSLTTVANGLTRLVHFGAGTESGRFSLRASNIDTLQFWAEFNDRASWPVDLSTPRLVLHLVYDSDESQEADRAKLYVGGVLATNGSVNATIDPSLPLNIASSNPVAFHIGNRDEVSINDGRSAAGTYHYVALYDVALNDDEIEQNAAELAVRDDP